MTPTCVGQSRPMPATGWFRTSPRMIEGLVDRGRETTVATRPAFHPSTTSAAAAAGAELVRRSAEQADSAAAECWAALLGGCDSPGRRLLPARLRELADTTAIYA